MDIIFNGCFGVPQGTYGFRTRTFHSSVHQQVAVEFGEQGFECLGAGIDEFFFESMPDAMITTLDAANGIHQYLQILTNNWNHDDAVVLQ